MITIHKTFSKNRKFDWKMKKEVNNRLLEMMRYFIPIAPTANEEIRGHIKNFFPKDYEQSQMVDIYYELMGKLMEDKEYEISDVEKYILYHIIQSCRQCNEPGIDLDEFNLEFIQGIEIYDRFEYLENISSLYDLIFDSYDFLKE